MAKPKNAYLAKLQAQAETKARAVEAMKTETHVEIDTIAMLLACRDVFEAGKGRSGKLVNAFLAYKMEIAEKIVTELRETQGQKDIDVTRHHLTVDLKRILGPVNWEQYKTLFPFLRDFWEVKV